MSSSFLKVVAISHLSIGAIAQTNLQLWQQLRDGGYSDDDLEQIGHVYCFAITLFAGRYRASGKPFIAHLTGTASVLTHLRATSKVIAAGLLHAAYDFGDFGGWCRKGVTSSKQACLRRVVGIDVEAYVEEYSALEWSSATIPRILRSLPEWDVMQREVLLIRLANELEEYLDLGLLYCGYKSEIYGDHQSALIADMAYHLQQPELAAALLEAQQVLATTTVSPFLVNPTGLISSGLMVPLSCQRKPLAWLAQVVNGLKDAIEHHLGQVTHFNNNSHDSQLSAKGKAL